MTWNVYRYDVNKRKICVFNIFKHSSFKTDAIKHLKECETLDDFSQKLTNTLSYYFWCKSEYEIFLCGYIKPKENEILMVDIFEQVTNNWKPFLNYVWSYKNEVTK